jgi:TonB family protein
VLSISAAVHIFLFVGLGFSPAADGASLNQVLDFEVLQTEEPESESEEPESEKPEPEEPEEPEPPEPRKAAPEPKATRKTAAQEEAPPPAPGPERQDQSAEPEPVDFPGFTLTAESGQSSWTTAVGSGAPIRAPVVVPKPQKKTAVASGSQTGTGSGSGKRKKNLSRPPQQPANMDQTLLRNYPKQAKMQGIEGIAVMKVLISPSGKASNIRLVRESYDGFGDACEKTLERSRWRPKLDERGRPIPVEITYTCRFEVGY